MTSMENWPLEARIVALMARAETAEKRANQLERTCSAIYEIVMRSTPCNVQHQGYRPGTTCLIKMLDAEVNARKYTTAYRLEILEGKHLCKDCALSHAVTTLVERQNDSLTSNFREADIEQMRAAVKKHDDRRYETCCNGTEGCMGRGEKHGCDT